MTNIQLRTLKEGDAKQLEDLYESTLNEMQAMILYQSLLKHRTYGIFDADILVGIIQIYERSDGTYEIGYRTKHAYQHKGYMYRGVKLLLEECKKLNITKLYARVDKNNVNSKKVLDNTGFLQQFYNGDVMLYVYEIKG